MGAAATVRMYVNSTKGCWVGKSPEPERLTDWDRRYVASLNAGGYLFDAAPGDVVVDTHGTLWLALQSSMRRFVECHDIEEARSLGVPQKDMVFGDEHYSGYPKQLLGFYGINRVYKQTDAYADILAKTGNRVASAEALVRAEADKVALQKRVEEMTIKHQAESVEKNAAMEKMQRELRELQAQVQRTTGRRESRENKVT